MKLAIFLLLNVLTRTALCGFLPHSLDLNTIDMENAGLLQAVEDNSILRGQGQLVAIPRGQLKSSDRAVSVDGELLNDLENIQDAMGLLKHDEFLEEILFVRTKMGQFGREGKAQADQWKLDQAEFLKGIYQDISKSFVDYAEMENPVLLKSFANRIRPTLKKYNLSHEGSTKEFIRYFYESAYHELFNKKVAEVFYPYHLAPKAQRDQLLLLAETYGESFSILDVNKYKIENIGSLEGSIYSSFAMTDLGLDVALNLRGYRELEKSKKVILPIAIKTPVYMERDLKVDISCSFENVDREIWSDPQVQVLEDQRNYTRNIKQVITKKFLQSDSCQVKVENLDLEKDHALIVSLLSDKLGLDQLKKTGKVDESIKIDRGEMKYYTIPTNMKVEL